MPHFTVGPIHGVDFDSIAPYGAAKFDPTGKPIAPRGSIQSYSIFRERQQQLDVGSMCRDVGAARREANQKFLERRPMPKVSTVLGPTRLIAKIGGFCGPRHEVRWQGGKLLYRTDGLEAEVAPSAAEWKAFWVCHRPSGGIPMAS